jgi:hypothetical protein
VLGGVAWERLPVDPVPGPRAAREIVGGEPIGEHAVLAGPATTTPEGVPFSEAHVAAHLGAPTVLIDVTGGPGGAARGIGDAAGALGCDLVVLADIGGDAIADGSEPGLGSPLCDAVMVAAALALDRSVDSVLAVLGSGCDGELEPDEVLGRVAALAAAGAWIGSSSVRRAEAAEIEAAARATGTEASVQMARCAAGATGRVEIRGGRRSVALGPLGALGFWFDPGAAAGELPLAAAVRHAGDLAAARDALAGLGLSTELDFELRNAAVRPADPAIPPSNVPRSPL